MRLVGYFKRNVFNSSPQQINFEVDFQKTIIMRHYDIKFYCSNEETTSAVLSQYYLLRGEIQT